MGNNSMNLKGQGQTNPGGEYMDYQEITIGQVTYEVSHFCSGDRTVDELLLGLISKPSTEKPSFDGDTNLAV